MNVSYAHFVFSRTAHKIANKVTGIAQQQNNTKKYLSIFALEYRLTLEGNQVHFGTNVKEKLYERYNKFDCSRIRKYPSNILINRNIINTDTSKLKSAKILSFAYRVLFIRRRKSSLRGRTATCRTCRINTGSQTSFVVLLTSKESTRTGRRRR